MRSDRSMNPPMHFKSGDTQTDLRYTLDNKKYDNSMAFLDIIRM